MAKSVRVMKCNRCKKQVRGVSMLGHLWKAHHAFMMKNHAKGPRAKVVEEKAPRAKRAPTEKPREAEPQFHFTCKEKPFRVVLVTHGKNTIEIRHIEKLEIYSGE